MDRVGLLLKYCGRVEGWKGGRLIGLCVGMAKKSALYRALENTQIKKRLKLAYAAGQQVLAVAANETANEAADTAAAGAN